MPQPGRLEVTFDDERLVANAGLVLPATLAQHLGLRELVDEHVDLGDAPGHAKVGDEAMTLVPSAAFRTSGAAEVAPSGTMTRSQRRGHGSQAGTQATGVRRQGAAKESMAR
jgi:hypothetical protein